MKISLSWLKEYVDTELMPDKLADALTMAGLEVETVSDRYAYLQKVLVGRIIKATPMEGSKKLQLCSVDIGGREISLVCGAPNAGENMLCAVAMPGASLPGGLLIKKSKIRGEVSEGMICSGVELGINGDGSGIMILEGDHKPGEKISDVLSLSDMVFDIDITPNRPDCLSVIGIAREIAAFEGKPLKCPRIGSFLEKSGNSDQTISDLASVRIEAPDHCPRYAASILEEVSVGDSPFWLQDRLISVGMKPINNIVDITNFVMMEMGQPLHAFDLDQLAENRIVVRKAVQGESFVTLDGKERILSDETLMICDAEKPVAIGGVMGGLNSEIEPDTRRVLLESAYFSPKSIRKTAKALGLNTESAYRFERGIDPCGTLAALKRAAALMVEISDARLVSGTLDEMPKPFQEKTIHLSVRESNRLLGVDFSGDEMTTFLESIAFSVEKKEDGDLSVTPPSFRVDVDRPVDLMEEIARLSGYDNIIETFPAIPGQASLPEKHRKAREKIKNSLIGFGFSEAINYSFVTSESCDLLKMGEDDRRRDVVKILNPLSSQQDIMRSSLVHGMLETVARNFSRQSKNLKMFETGKIFVASADAMAEKKYGEAKNAPLPEETEMLLCCQTGLRFQRAWNQKEVECDFYDIKGIAEALFQILRVEGVSFAALPENQGHYIRAGRGAGITVDGAYAGLVGEADPDVLKKYDISSPVFILEINMDLLGRAVPDIKETAPLPKFPSVSRDITIIVDQRIEAGRILSAIRECSDELTEDVQVFDVFCGAPIPEGKVSLTFRVTYRSSQRTLEDEEATRINKKIADTLMETFNIDLPA